MEKRKRKRLKKGYKTKKTKCVRINTQECARRVPSCTARPAVLVPQCRTLPTRDRHELRPLQRCEESSGAHLQATASYRLNHGCINRRQANTPPSLVVPCFFYIPGERWRHLAGRQPRQRQRRLCVNVVLVLLCRRRRLSLRRAHVGRHCLLHGLRADAAHHKHLLVRDDGTTSTASTMNAPRVAGGSSRFRRGGP